VWSKLAGEKPAPGEKSSEEDPGASLMNMMKKMYDDGDDTMKKVTAGTCRLPSTPAHLPLLRLADHRRGHA
jgi:hypothetical protein